VSHVDVVLDSATRFGGQITPEEDEACKCDSLDERPCRTLKLRYQLVERIGLGASNTMTNHHNAV